MVRQSYPPELARSRCHVGRYILRCTRARQLGLSLTSVVYPSSPSLFGYIRWKWCRPFLSRNKAPILLQRLKSMRGIFPLSIWWSTSSLFAPAKACPTESTYCASLQTSFTTCLLSCCCRPAALSSSPVLSSFFFSVVPAAASPACPLALLSSDGEREIFDHHRDTCRHRDLWCWSASCRWTVQQSSLLKLLINVLNSGLSHLAIDVQKQAIAIAGYSGS